MLNQGTEDKMAKVFLKVALEMNVHSMASQMVTILHLKVHSTSGKMNVHLK